MNKPKRLDRNASGHLVPSGISAHLALRKRADRSGFTLVELLVVILIILLVSAITLPVVIPALAHREVSEAARILQAALAGARDAAMRSGAPSGIRLLPDPAFPLAYINTPGPNFGMIDSTKPLAVSRIIPIEAAPDYSEGALNASGGVQILNMPYPLINGGGYYPVLNHSTASANVLMVEESVIHLDANQTVLNSPTCWFWNIRVGDKLQINGAGIWYTVVGPMVITPQSTNIGGVTYANPEMFVNVGPPGTGSPWAQRQASRVVYPEFLFLVNGVDDNRNGWIDEGFDGIDNDANGIIDDLSEWEFEAWTSPSPAIGATNVPYTIQRRPAPASNSRETAFPSNVVIDLTTSSYALPERSQFPQGVLNPYTGYVDILVNPNGTVLPTTIYSTPSAIGMSGAFYQFWLAERKDINAPGAPSSGTKPPYLPIGNIPQHLQLASKPYVGPQLQGEYRVVTLFSRTGLIMNDDNVQFDNPLNPANGASYNTNFPFLAAQLRFAGGRQ
jgi:prepilin-type N-terminal cleavage/methylation domain-containing protein